MHLAPAEFRDRAPSTYRRAAGLSQEVLAQRAGLSVRGISDLERELRRAPRRMTVEQLVTALGLDQKDVRDLPRQLHQRPGLERRRVGAPPFRLPAFVTSFVGRELAVSEVRQLVQSNRLVTVSGPPGIGKTRLARQVASSLRESPDGWNCPAELASVAEPGLVEHAVAAALGVQGAAGAHTLGGYCRPDDRSRRAARDGQL